MRRSITGSSSAINLQDFYKLSSWGIVWKNFLAGTFYGIGFFLGTSIFLALLGYFVNKLAGEIPFFSDLAEAIRVWLETMQR